MSDTKNANALFKAVKAGDIAKIDQLLASGTSIESVDVNQMTPIMLAAQAGQVEAFHALIKHGANVDAQALGQKDLLESAAEGGSVDIIRYLLDQKHPVDGHWTPRSKVSERIGHMTPLILAAINGHVEAVRILLEAGANRDAQYDKQTSLKLVNDDIKFPNSPEEKERVPRLKQIAALLKGSASSAPKTDQSLADEVKSFAENAKRPAYAMFHQLMTQRCGASSAWEPVPDHGMPARNVVRFTLQGCKKQKELEELQAQARQAGCQLVLSEAWVPDEDALLVLFPTESKLAVVAAVGTEGANYSVTTESVIEWLAKLDQENPFHLTCCNHEMVGGVFAGAVKGVKKLAESIAEFCPSCMDEGFDSPEELAVAIKKEKGILLRWD